MLNLNDREWRPFFLTELFPEIQRGKRLKTENHIPGKTPYVSSSALKYSLQGTTPVSYTHLDVYKRQVADHPWSAFLAPSRLTP